ncbi:Homocysteine S-methyltransferase [Pseudocohnilembus persalinus]|uniref:Homocysteine S-methyltransferase n=1 Tax=Pseudocohnilembus persalinus TaxID=266149 RepID=A0A0V0QK88_PSEPJ|nr:Homocysteine S-methyltransferase [Pseudocohnilembus persalinus]|eukprot:KRX02713.1 Homocysteine S-methyltransferase [Pseudocohnilembus persalinus]
MSLELQNQLKLILKQRKNSPIILDGGLGSELHRLYQDNKDLEQLLATPLWSAIILDKDPQSIQKTHLNYFLAGCDICITSSYQANPSVFKQQGISEQKMENLFLLTYDLVLESIKQINNPQISQQFDENSNINYKNQNQVNQQEQKKFIAISLGPYGAKDGLEYNGDYSEKLQIQDLVEFHKQRLYQILKNPNITNVNSFLLFETIPNKLEIQAIIQLINQEKNQSICNQLTKRLPIMVSVQCQNAEKNAKGENLIEEIWPLLIKQEQIIGIGINCCMPQYVEEIIQNLKQFLKQNNSEKFIICYPNSGKIYDIENKKFKPNTGLDPQQFSELTAKWYKAGADIIGGCCGTTPEYIKEIKNVFK